MLASLGGLSLGGVTNTKFASVYEIHHGVDTLIFGRIMGNFCHICDIYDNFRAFVLSHASFSKFPFFSHLFNVYPQGRILFAHENSYLLLYK